MTIPFLSLFKRKPKVEAAPAPPPPPLEKPDSEKFKKTVMPTGSRTVTPMAPALATVEAAVPPGNSPRPASAATVAAAAAPRSISFAAPAPAPKDLPRPQIPPAVAMALEPKVERTISLELRDVVPSIPAGLTHPLETLDADRRVLFKAAEVERGMANGRPAVSLTSIHQQMPEIFLKPVTATDTTQVSLPFSKVLDEFTKLQVRADQVRQAAAPQVETPFLKVAVEDGAKFGTPIDKLETAEMPPVRLEPATAETISQAEPEPAAAEPSAKPAVPFKMDGAQEAGRRPAATGSAAPAAPKRIAFKLSPNGTDAPANESVPASGGPSVPKVSAETPVAAPARIPFKLEPSAEEEAPPKAEPWLTAEALGLPPRNKQSESQPASASSDQKEPKIRLNLHAVLKALLEFQLSGDPATVPSDVEFELPFAIVEPQLASGRVMVRPEVFAAAIPQSFRSLFKADCAAEVALPLQEVLKNLPAASLKMRHDQVEQELGETFETPFSKTAEEDAKRFKVEPKPAPVAEVAGLGSGKKPEEPRPATAATGESVRTPLQVALDTNENLDAKGVVAHINRLAGVKASTFLFHDGLNLAGSLPPEVGAEGLCAMAPALLQRVENHVADTKLGALRGMTLACAKGTMSFFMHDNLCLAALHSNGEIPADVREKLGRVVLEMSRKYSHPV